MSSDNTTLVLPKNVCPKAHSPRMRPSRAEAEAAVRTLLCWAGDDPNREGLIGTPDRVVRAYEEFFSGYDQDPTEILHRTFEETDGYDEMVLLRDIRLELNSIGDAQERSVHRAALIAYLEQHNDILDAEAKRRLYSNPLRILDTKNPAMQEMVNAAPKLLDYLGEESMSHFVGVQKILRDNSIPFTINTRLVRGMDYYNRTVFEWVTDQLGSQGTVCGGGRYDTLFGMFGGKPTPACGFAMGIERLLELMKESGEAHAPAQCDVYLVHQGVTGQAQSFVLGERLRDAGLDVVLHCATASGQGSFKSQMKKADGSGAAYAIIIGDDEAAANTVTIKAMRTDDLVNNQISVPFDTAVDYIVDQITGVGQADECCDDPTHLHIHH